MSYAELAQQMVDLHTKYYSEMGQLSHQMSSGGEGIVLHLLLTGKGEVFAEDLARLTGLSAGRVASILRKLEDRGLITRVRDESNRRKLRIQLTKAGVAAAQEAEQSLLAVHEDVLRQLGEKDAQEFLHIVTRLCQIYKDKCDE